MAVKILTLNIPLFSSGAKTQLNSPYDLQRIDPITGVVRPHYGADWVPSPNKQPAYVVAAGWGKVTAVTNEKWRYIDKKSVTGVPSSKWAGTNLFIEHGKDSAGRVVKTRCEHLEYGTVKVIKGQIVKPGDILATMGTTGWSTGNHLHFEVWVGDTRVDPLPYLTGEKSLPTSYKPAEPKPPKPPKADTYTVKKGDTLWAIAKKYGVTINDLVAWNGIANPNLLKVGQKLTIGKPAAKPPVPKPPAPKPKPKAGDKVMLALEPLYLSASAKKRIRLISGTYWLYDGVEMNGRFRITNNTKRVGKKPVTLYVTGWIDTGVIK